MTSIEIKPPEHQPAENPLLGALLQVAGLVARHGLSAERIDVSGDGRTVAVNLWRHPDPLPLEQVEALAHAWEHALGVSRVHVGRPHFKEGEGACWGRTVSLSGRVGQVEVSVHGFGSVPTRMVEVAS